MGIQNGSIHRQHPFTIQTNHVFQRTVHMGAICNILITRLRQPNIILFYPTTFYWQPQTLILASYPLLYQSKVKVLQLIKKAKTVKNLLLAASVKHFILRHYAVKKLLNGWMLLPKHVV